MNQSLSQIISQPVMSFTQYMNQGVSQTVTQLVGQPINQSISQSINQSNNQSFNQSNNQFINDWVVTLSLQMKPCGVSMMKDKLNILSDGTNKIPFHKMKLQIVTVFLLKWLKTARTATFISEKCFTQFSLIFLTVGKILYNGVHTITKIQALSVFIIPH